MHRSAIILGGANTVWLDIKKAFELHNFETVLAVNDIGCEYPKVDHWCTMHPEKMDSWIEKRRANGYPDPKAFWTAYERTGRTTFDYEMIRNTKGGSGLLAVYVARKLGYKKIVLAGIPMHQQFEHYHTPGTWRECHFYQVVWEHDKSLTEFDDVRSLSGWTKERYGEPTLEWLTAP